MMSEVLNAAWLAVVKGGREIELTINEVSYIDPAVFPPRSLQMVGRVQVVREAPRGYELEPIEDRRVILTLENEKPTACNVRIISGMQYPEFVFEFRLRPV